MVAMPTFIVRPFIWCPPILSIILSFTSWNGIGGHRQDQVHRASTTTRTCINYPPFWPALPHNLIWLGWFLLFIATPLGIFFAVLLDKEMRGSRFYQSALYMPVVLSLAIVGLHLAAPVRADPGLHQQRPRHQHAGEHVIDWLGNQNLNLWAVLVAACWRHVGYVMVLYLAGLKAFDPSLREAAQIDGANERQTFFRVVFPVLKPINIVVLVITVIESLRAFDLVYIINRGINGLELLSVLVTNNILGEASRVGLRVGHRRGAAADLRRARSSTTSVRAMREETA